MFPKIRKELTDKIIQAIQYKNVGLQGEICAKDQQIEKLEKRYVGYLENTSKNNGITIIAKNDASLYPYIAICGQHGYRTHKTKVSLVRNTSSFKFADSDTPNSIVAYNFWREHRLIITDPNRPRHFRLEGITQEQLMRLN